MKSLITLIFLTVPFFTYAGEERPDMAIKIKASVVCEKGESLGASSFQKFCRETNDHTRTHYALLSPSNDIAFNLFFDGPNNLETPEAWCSQEIDDGRTPPHCILGVY